MSIKTFAVALTAGSMLFAGAALAEPMPKPPTFASTTGGPFTALGGYAFGTAIAIPTMLILRAGYVAYTENRQLTQKEANETFFGTLIPPLGLYYIARDVSAKK